MKRPMLHPKKKPRGKKGRKGDKRSYNTTSFNYDNLPYSNAFTSVPIGKALRFDGMDYTKWRYSMNMHLISLNLSVWTIVCIDVNFLDGDEELGFEQLQQIHRNAQASLVLLSSLEKDEFDRVNGLEKAKSICDTLQRTHEGTKPVKKAKRQLIEGQLDRFVMLYDEDPQEMYNWLKMFFNKVRAYGLRRWSDRRVIDRMLQTYVVKYTTVISFIQQDPTLKKMTLDDVLGKIINHEMLAEESQHVKNLSKGIISSKKHDIAFKDSKKSKGKKAVEESSSEEEDDEGSDDESTEYDLEEMALFIRRLSKMIGKQKFFKGDKTYMFRSRTKRVCYNCDKYVHYITNWPHERREEEDDKKNKKERSYKKYKHYKKKSYGEAHNGKEWDSDDESSDSVAMVWPP
jgi:hypothetical protein